MKKSTNLMLMFTTMALIIAYGEVTNVYLSAIILVILGYLVGFSWGRMGYFENKVKK